MKKLHVVIIKPGKYGVDGFVERFRRGFMPNATAPYLASMTPERLDGHRVETDVVDEYVQTDLQYLRLLRKRNDGPTLVALAGVQSHQFHRSLDLAALALSNGVEHVAIGGPHAMTTDTSMLHGRGVSFSLAEAEQVWTTILRDALGGELRPVYGLEGRWQERLESPVTVPPSSDYSSRYIVPMMGIYPARGCPFRCNFCSVIKIAGQQIRSQPIDVTIRSLRAARAAGVRMVMFTSDNFNKYPEAAELLEAMIADNLRIPLMVQCDTQIARQESFVELLARAGCFQIFVGVESFNRKVLVAAQKTQNHPHLYGEIVRLARSHGITTHFSNIIGFPSDSAADVGAHLDILRELSPDMASFYILTPIPGTEQYDDFLAEGRIYETNLDRFDATCPTWHHDKLGPAELSDLLFSAYRRFYSGSKLVRRWPRARYGDDASPEFVRFLEGVGANLFARYAAMRRMHPMSGGVGRVALDHADRYRPLRRARFGYDLVPLPASLPAESETAAARAVSA